MKLARHGGPHRDFVAISVGVHCSCDPPLSVTVVKWYWDIAKQETKGEREGR